MRRRLSRIEHAPRAPLPWLGSDPRLRKGPHRPLARALRRWKGWRRRAWLHWAIVGGLTLLVTAAVTTTVERAERLADSYGQRRTVAIAIRTLEPGSVIAPNDVEIVERPLAFSPTDVTTSEAIGRVVRERVLVGEPVREARLGRPGLGGMSALMEPGERAVALPKAVGPSVSPGDLVEIVGPGGLDANAVVLGRGRVLGRDDTATVTVALPASDAPAVAAAAADGQATLVLVAPGD
ncbi:MAG: SAF domain-containing protein [Acidimicrobiales bacterium]|nr:SAF domain-containing protein [Acidimicrobiales bacterium]